MTASTRFQVVKTRRSYVRYAIVSGAQARQPIAYILAVLMTMLGTYATHAQSISTDQWAVERNAEWAFMVSLPPGWTILNHPLGSTRLWIRQDLPDGGKLMCQIGTEAEPRTAGMNQMEVNNLVSSESPSVQNAEALLSSSGIPTRVYESTFVWINGRPSYHFTLSRVLRSMNKQWEQKALNAIVYIPGRDYSLDCSASTTVLIHTDELYSQWLPTFRAFFSTFFVTAST
jgi:hypothetical protein